MKPLASRTTVESVENVLVYISDSLRYDALPDAVASRGVTARGIAPSTFTASSLPSILTGQFPHEHKVWGFSDQLRETPVVFTGAPSSGLNVSRVWGTEYELHEKPSLTLLNVDRHTDFDALDRAFTYIIHDHGGHSPYGNAGDRFKPSQSFFDDHYADEDHIHAQYRDGIKQSVDRFLGFYRALKSAGELEDTLVIFTSDHGELLGEYGGIYEHTSPMVPEVLEVPLVFCGAGLPGGERIEPLVSSVDIAPSLLSAQGRPIPTSMRGADLWTSTDPERPIRADIWRKSSYGKHIRYAASSIWDDNGGVVVHRGSRAGRAAFALGANFFRAPYARVVRKHPLRNLGRLLAAHVPTTVRYGSYDGPVAPSELKAPSFETAQDMEQVTVDSEKLEALGYLD